MAWTCPTDESRLDAKGCIEMETPRLPQGKRSRERSKITWRKTMEKDLVERGFTLKKTRQQAQDPGAYPEVFKGGLL